MLNIILFVLAVAALSISLGWRLSWDAVRAFTTGSWAGATALVTMPWSFAKLDTLGLFIFAWGKRILFVVGVILLLASLAVGADTVAGGDPRSDLDHAIRAFQSFAGLKPDGLFGPSTVKAYYGHR